MGGHCIFLSHWHGGGPPATLALDTEIRKEKLGYPCVFRNGRIKKVIVTWGRDYYSEHFFYYFLRSIVGPTVALQAGNKIENNVSDLSHVCPIFLLA